MPLWFGRDQLPATVDDAVDRIIASLPESDAQSIRETPEEGLARFHHGLGRRIRDEFGLWRGNPTLLKACKRAHPDDASTVLIKGVWNHLRGNPIDYHLHPVVTTYACPVCGKNTYREAWTRDELEAFPNPPCRACQWEQSPDGVRQKKARDDRNAAVNLWQERARALGLRVRAACEASPAAQNPASAIAGIRDDHELLDLALSLYESDAEFRQLWGEVHEAPPGEKHVSWLSRWRPA